MQLKSVCDVDKSVVFVTLPLNSDRNSTKNMPYDLKTPIIENDITQHPENEL